MNAIVITLYVEEGEPLSSSRIHVAKNGQDLGFITTLELKAHVNGAPPSLLVKFAEDSTDIPDGARKFILEHAAQLKNIPGVTVEVPNELLTPEELQAKREMYEKMLEEI